MAVKSLGKALGSAGDELVQGVENALRTFGLKGSRQDGPDYILPPDPSPEELLEAQKEAAKPISKGGLGLPPDNTPVERAKAQGYSIPFYHGAEDKSLRSIDPMYGKDPMSAGRGFFGATDPPEVAETYATPSRKPTGELEKGSVFPLLMRSDDFATSTDPSSPARIGRVDFGSQSFDDAEDVILDLPDGRQITQEDDYRLGSLSTDELIDIAKEYNLDGIEAINIIDRGPRSYPGTREALEEAEYGTSGGTEAIAFSEGLVRAPNAAFNPAKRGSRSLTAGLSGTAIALGLVSTPEEAEAAYIPLKAFAEGSDAAKALFERAMKRIDEGADTRPNGELYNEMAVYRSEDGDLKVDLAELKGRSVESAQALARFDQDLKFYLESDVARKKDFKYPITRYIPKDSPIFENFPELADAEVEIAPRSTSDKGKRKHYSNQGFYMPAGPWNGYKNQIVITVPTRKGLGSTLTEEDVKNQVLNSFNTLVHEFQHYIQDVKKAANQGFNSINSKEAFKSLEKDYEDAVEALKTLQPGELGYDQYKDKVDAIHDMTRYSIPTFKERKAFLALSDQEKAEATKKLIKEFKSSRRTLPSDRFQLAISLRELGEAEARSSALKALIPEGAERKAIGVFYPSLESSVVASASEIPLANRIPNKEVFVRAVPEYDLPKSNIGEFQFSEFVGTDIEDAPAIKKLQANRDASKKGLAGTAVATGTAAGVASSPSEAFVAGIGERTGLFEDGSPTPSLFDVEGVSDELGISNTFLLDLLVPRTKPYDLISNIPGVGEAMMGADLLQGLGSPDAESSDEFSDIDRDVAGMRQGGGIETEAGKEMAKEKFQLDERKADLDKDGELSAYEKARGEAVQRAMGEGKETKMAMGGMMGGMMADPFAPLQVTVDIDEESGNEVPAGSKEEEVRDDIPAMLSEGEYVVPADVVRYHGLKTFEELRCEAKEALGLMAMHDRISFVDDETKEPVEYDIEEKDLPEVEEAEVEVVEAAKGTDVQPATEGTDVQPATEPTTFYQLQYKTDPVTGQVRIVYVDPLTGQEVKREEYEEERASRFAPQKLLEREVFTPGEEVAEEEEEEKKEPLVPLPVDDGGDGPEPTPKGPTYSYTNAELDAALSKQLTTYTAPTEMEIPPAVGVFSPVISAVATVVKGIGDYFTRNSALNQVRAGENLGSGVAPTGDYADWRSNMSNGLAGSVAITEQEARDTIANNDLRGTSFGSMAEAEAVADYGWGSDEAFEAIERGFDRTTTTAQDRENALAAVSDGSEDKYGSGLRRGNDYRTSLEDQGFDMTTFDEARGPGRRGEYYDGTEEPEDTPEEDDDLNVSDDDFGMNKGGYVSRKNTPRTATIKY